MLNVIAPIRTEKQQNSKTTKRATQTPRNIAHSKTVFPQNFHSVASTNNNNNNTKTPKITSMTSPGCAVGFEHHILFALDRLPKS
jgi:hypothetical protein